MIEVGAICSIAEYYRKDRKEILKLAKASGFDTDDAGNIYYEINEFESVDITKELLHFFELLKLKNELG